MYFVVGNQLWVIDQLLYVKNEILASVDLNSGRRSHCSCCRPFWSNTHGLERVFAKEKINLSLQSQI
jgi:hypothetical protein